mmetsp:Transcript_24253/g.77868  ORF Transcript_24253/g.77868 Transcript_24253/m.77868 type:complete len:280 (+) Transcript_24253:2204-3043(+)
MCGCAGHVSQPATAAAAAMRRPLSKANNSLARNCVRHGDGGQHRALDHTKLAPRGLRIERCEHDPCVHCVRPRVAKRWGNDRRHIVVRALRRKSHCDLVGDQHWDPKLLCHALERGCERGEHALSLRNGSSGKVRACEGGNRVDHNQGTTVANDQGLQLPKTGRRGREDESPIHTRSTHILERSAEERGEYTCTRRARSSSRADPAPSAASARKRDGNRVCAIWRRRAGENLFSVSTKSTQASGAALAMQDTEATSATCVFPMPAMPHTSVTEAGRIPP